VKRICVCCLAMIFFISSVVLAQNMRKEQVNAETLFENKCSTCHSTNRPKSKQKTASEWAETVARMREHGCVLTDKEAKIIVDYLAKNYGK
jgi:cytochrome c5